MNTDEVLRAVALCAVGFVAAVGIVWECFHERERQRRAEFDRLLALMADEFTEMARVIGTHLIPAVRAAAAAFAGLVRAWDAHQVQRDPNQ